MMSEGRPKEPIVGPHLHSGPHHLLPHVLLLIMRFSTFIPRVPLLSSKPSITPICHQTFLSNGSYPTQRYTPPHVITIPHLTFHQINIPSLTVDQKAKTMQPNMYSFLVGFDLLKSSESAYIAIHTKNNTYKNIYKLATYKILIFI